MLINKDKAQGSLDRMAVLWIQNNLTAGPSNAGPPSIFALMKLPLSMLPPPKDEVVSSSGAVPAHSFT